MTNHSTPNPANGAPRQPIRYQLAMMSISQRAAFRATIFADVDGDKQVRLGFLSLFEEIEAGERAAAAKRRYRKKP